MALLVEKNKSVRFWIDNISSKRWKPLENLSTAEILWCIFPISDSGHRLTEKGLVYFLSVGGATL